MCPQSARTMGHDAAADNIETLKVFIVIQQNVRVTGHKDDQCLTNDWGGTHEAPITIILSTDTKKIKIIAFKGENNLLLSVSTGRCI